MYVVERHFSDNDCLLLGMRSSRFAFIIRKYSKQAMNAALLLYSAAIIIGIAELILVTILLFLLEKKTLSSFLSVLKLNSKCQVK